MLKLALIAVILSILSGIAYGLVQYGRTLENAEWQWKVLQAERGARADEKRKQGTINEVIKKQYNEIATINANLNNDIIELSNRPARSVSRDTGVTCDGATGKSLYSDDSVFLRGQFARADRIRSSLNACKTAYDSLSD